MAVLHQRRMIFGFDSPTAEGTLAGAACVKVATKRRGCPLGRDIFLPLRLSAADVPGNGTQPRFVAYPRTTRSQQPDGETRSEAGISPRVKRSAELMPHNLSPERNLPEPLKIRLVNPSIAHQYLQSSKAIFRRTMSWPWKIRGDRAQMSIPRELR